MREKSKPSARVERAVQIVAGRVKLEGDLVQPAGARGVVLFAHGSGSSRHSLRNRSVAARMHGARFATLLLDLLTKEEEELDVLSSHIRFDIPLLAGRVEHAVHWLRGHDETSGLPLGLFGASTGAAAALIAAAHLPRDVAAIVSRGGRGDLAGRALSAVRAATLFIVGSADKVVLDLNREARAMMTAATELQVIEGAGHLFEEEGALEHVADLSIAWFERYAAEGVKA
jgi:pimeloyl-ACP methyl ester carboxylesterase